MRKPGVVFFTLTKSPLLRKQIYCLFLLFISNKAFCEHRQEQAQLLVDALVRLGKRDLAERVAGGSLLYDVTTLPPPSTSKPRLPSDPNVSYSSLIGKHCLNKICIIFIFFLGCIQNG